MQLYPVSALFSCVFLIPTGATFLGSFASGSLRTQWDFKGPYCSGPLKIERNIQPRYKLEGCGSSVSESAIPTASNTEDFASPISERVAQVAAFKTIISTKNETLTSLIISMQLTSTHSVGHSADVVSFVIETDQLGGRFFGRSSNPCVSMYRPVLHCSRHHLQSVLSVHCSLDPQKKALKVGVNFRPRGGSMAKLS